MTKQELQKMSLNQLRIVGREIGVKGATKFNKQPLIEQILDLYSGKTQPTFSKRGRPALNSKLYIGNLDEYFVKLHKLEQIIAKTNKEIAELFSK